VDVAIILGLLVVLGLALLAFGEAVTKERVDEAELEAAESLDGARFPGNFTVGTAVGARISLFERPK